MSMKAKKQIGKVTHFFSKIGVAVVEVSDSMKVGDTITIEGPLTNVEQKVESMQIDHVPVLSAKKGESVGMKVSGVVREGDGVFRKG